MLHAERGPSRRFSRRPPQSFDPRRLLVVALAVGAVAPGVRRLLDTAATTMAMPYEAAQPIVRAFRDRLPPALVVNGANLDAEHWANWASTRDRDIRGRLAQGDEDAVVNLWMFGTSFTNEPRATAPTLATLGPQEAAGLLQRRLDDLVAGMRAPGTDERLAVARAVLERGGVGVMAPAGRLDAIRRLEALRRRMLGQLAQFRRDTVSAEQHHDETAAFDTYSAYYRGRGLASDTSLLATYSVERALQAIVPTRLLPPRSVGRVAIVGPGLDFVDKAEGHDFYPQQTLQPFALVDSLVRSGLADPDGLDVTLFDISPRVLEHVRQASLAVAAGHDYVLQLPLDQNDPSEWHHDLVAYWQRFGNWIGTSIEPQPPPPGLEGIRVRAVRVRPQLVAALHTVDLDIVLQRLTPSALSRRFDLIVATNVLVYYDPFEQSLALSNIAAMLRPDGLFLTNTLVVPPPSVGFSAASPVGVQFDLQGRGDTLFWLRRLAAAER